MSILSFQKWCLYLSFGQKSSSAFLFTSLAIQEMMLLWCQRQRGKFTILFEISNINHLRKLFIGLFPYMHFCFCFWTWRFPFDWKNPIGYSCAVILEYLMTACIANFVGSLAILGISTYLMGAAINKDIRRNLHSINDNTEIKKNRLIIIEQFSDFIQIHSMAKQLSNISL